jgi:TRAP-type C4-dicarboxylate transport system substrate-binding protein
MEPWGHRVELLTNNRVKFEWFHGGTLAQAKDAYDITVNGVADISWANLNYMPGRFKKTEVLSLPFLCSETNLRNTMAAWKMYPKYFADEFKDEVKVISLAVPPGNNFYTVKKMIKTIADFKGMKISVHPKMAKVIELLGGTPVPLPITEVYEALQRGIIDGCCTDDMICEGFKFYEICKYKTTISLYADPCIYIMNRDSYDRLPDDIKAIIDSESSTIHGYYQALTCDFSCERSREFLRQYGMQFYTFPELERKKAIKLAQPMIDDWIAKMEADGLPAREMIDELQKCQEEFKCLDKTIWY